MTDVRRSPGAVWNSPRLRGLRSRYPVLWYCAGVYLAVRVALFALGQAIWVLSNAYLHPIVIRNHVVPQHDNWLEGLTAWLRDDAQQFMFVARHGYGSDPSGAFYPGYPLLIRAVSYVTFGHYVAAAYIVSNAALIGALVVLYKLTQQEYDEPIARRAVLYLCLFPTAFFLFDAYSESLFLLAAVAAFALARQRRWVWAGLAGAGATFTRSIGVVIVVALAAEALHQTIEDRRLRAGPGRSKLTLKFAGRLGASILPLAGIGSYLLFWQLRYHNWQHPFQLQETNWLRRFSLPWATLYHGIGMGFHTSNVGGHGAAAIEFVLVAAGVALGVVAAVRARAVYTVYAWGSILFFLCETGYHGSRPLLSDPRYLVVLFPLVWALARLGRRPAAHTAIVALSASGLTVLAWAFLGTGSIY